MAKYREAPAKPKTVEALQFTGMGEHVPQFSESMPGWVFAAFLSNRLEVTLGASGATLFFDGGTVVPGSWLIRHEDGDITACSAVDFLAQYQPLRKRAVRKPKANLAVAAE